MTSTTFSAFGSTLQPWDKDAVETVYGSGPPCQPPGISTQSQNQSVNSGSQVTLSVSPVPVTALGKSAPRFVSTTLVAGWREGSTTGHITIYGERDDSSESLNVRGHLGD